MRLEAPANCKQTQASGWILCHKLAFQRKQSPLVGGFYERMMALIKDKLARCFHTTKFLSWKTLTAAVAYVERAINSRPISFVSDDRDGEFPFTPNMFLSLNCKEWNENPYLYGPQPIQMLELNKGVLTSHATQRLKLITRLWDSFHESYISTLRQFHKDYQRPSPINPLKVGDVVLLKPPSPFKDKSILSRLKWRLARIEKLYPSPIDGHVRVVDLRISNQNGTSNSVNPKGITILKGQSINNLAPLEVQQKSPNNSSLTAPFKHSLCIKAH